MKAAERFPMPVTGRFRSVSLRLRALVRPCARLAAVGVAVSMTAACGSVPLPGARPTSDPYATVRATSQAAFAEGQKELKQGQLEQALISLDRAETTDPDHRADIKQALDQTVAQLRAQEASPSPAASPSAPPTPLGTVAPLLPPSVAPTVPAPAKAPAGVAATATPRLAPSPPPATPTAAVALVPWSDPGGRFRIQAPSGWKATTAPHSDFGTGLVSFTSPDGTAAIQVASDNAGAGATPELYSARLELTMQKTSGYSLESAQPEAVGTLPSFRRTFTLQASGTGGRSVSVRGFQDVVVKGSTAYILSAEAPAGRFAAVQDAFNRSVDTFTLP